MEKIQHSPNYKTGEKDNRDASKYRPISLLNIAGKVLDRLMIDRIMHHVHSNAGFNSNQYGFIPQIGTVDAEMTVKEIIEGNLKQKDSTSVVRLESEEHLMRHGGQTFCFI